MLGIPYNLQGLTHLNLKTYFHLDSDPELINIFIIDRTIIMLSFSAGTGDNGQIENISWAPAALIHADKAAFYECGFIGCNTH